MSLYANAMRLIGEQHSVDWSLPEEIGFVLLRKRDWRYLGLRSRLVRVPVYREPTIEVVLHSEGYVPAWERDHSWPGDPTLTRSFEEEGA